MDEVLDKNHDVDSQENELTATDIAFVAHNEGLMAGQAMDYLDANRVFRFGLERNFTRQNNELTRTGANAVVSSFRKAGLYPMNYDNKGWQIAFNAFGKLNKLLEQQRLEAGEKIPNITWIPKPRPISKREALTANDVSAN